MLRRDRKDSMEKLFPELPVLQREGLLVRPLEMADAADLQRLTREENVYRYLPTYLYEKQSEDMEAVIQGMYGEAMKESLILGVFQQEQFCGLIEAYGYRASIRKVSIGYRLLEEKWGQGIATEALGLVTEDLLTRRNILLITASVMPENKASARVLQKNGFTRVFHAVYEDWGYPKLTVADKWLKHQRLMDLVEAGRLWNYRPVQSE